MDQDGAIATDVWSIVERVAKVAGPIVIFGALAYYIGFVRQDALLYHFGLHTTLTELSPQEYAIRSTDALIPFTVGLSIYCLLLVGFSQLLVAGMRSGRFGHTRRISSVLIATGCLFVCVGVWRLARPVSLRGVYLLGPISLATGGLLVAYGVGTLQTLDGSWASPRWLSGVGRWVAGTSIAALVLVALFWAANDYSRAQGAERARELEDALPTRPMVVLYSTIQLASTASSLLEEEIDPGAGPTEYRYRYTGLRLFMKSGDRLFFIPSNWSSHTFPTQPILLIDDDDKIRMEISVP